MQMDHGQSRESARCFASSALTAHSSRGSPKVIVRCIKSPEDNLRTQRDMLRVRTSQVSGLCKCAARLVHPPASGIVRMLAARSTIIMNTIPHSPQSTAT